MWVKPDGASPTLLFGAASLERLENSVKETVLVTGATGFIGSHVVRLLLKKGDKKVVAGNASGSKRNLEDVQDQVEFVRADIGSFTSVLRMVEKHLT